MRLLIINPNTTADITARLVALAEAMTPPDVAVTGATARFGARYISSRASAAVAGHAALDLLAAHQDDCDVAILACFGDPGLAALREVARVPVVGMAEASFDAAARHGRFSVATGGILWQPMLYDYARLGPWGDTLASIRTVSQSGAELAAQPDLALQWLATLAQDCVDEDGASAVILGGAGLAGFAAPIAEMTGIPMLDSLTCSVEAALAAAGQPAPADPDRPDLESVGLSPALSALLRA